MVLYKRDSERPKPIGYDREKAAELMQNYDLEVLIVSSPENVFYMSGLPVRHHAVNPILFALQNQYPSIVLVYNDGDESLVVWDLYDRNYSWVLDTKGCLTPKNALRSIKRFLKKRNISRGKIGIENSLPYYITSFLAETFPQSELIPADNLLLDMQLVKSEEEINRITQSTRIAERAINEMIDATKPGISDLELIKIAKKTIIDEGAEGWDHFTMSIGESDPEAPGTGIKVKANDLVRYDIGAFYKGYVSDVNRYCFLGHPPPEVREPVEAIIQVQNACQKAIKPGADPKEILVLAEKTWREAGRQDSFIIIAHSLGLQTEEYHFFYPMHGGLTRKFQKGNVLDLEAWTLIKNYGTVGNEDTYVVTETGCKRISTLEMKIFSKNM